MIALPTPGWPAIARLLLRHWRPILAGGALAAVTVLLMLARADARRQAALHRAEVAAHRATIAGYRAAAAEAAASDARNAARVRTEQQKITREIENDFQARLDGADARYRRLRAQADAYRGSAAAADLSGAGDAACRAYAGTGCEDLPALLKAAQDNSDQLAALIDWNRRQAAVEVSGGEPGPGSADIGEHREGDAGLLLQRP